MTAIPSARVASPRIPSIHDIDDKAYGPLLMNIDPPALDSGSAGDHISRPVAPARLTRKHGRLPVGAPPVERGPNIWRRDAYDELVTRLDETRMRHVLGALLEQGEAMRGAMAGGSKTEIERKAHDLVSVGGMLGFEALSQACFELQVVGAGPMWEGALLAVSVALDRTIDRLRIHLAETGVVTI